MMTYEEAEQFVRDNPKPWRIQQWSGRDYIVSAIVPNHPVMIELSKLLAYIKYLEAKQVT